MTSCICLLFVTVFVLKVLFSHQGSSCLPDLQVARNTDNHPAFFAVYNMETTEIIAFYQVLNTYSNHILDLWLL